MQRLGQHFLKNRAVPEKIAGALQIAPENIIFEIGPGHGELTGPLAAVCAKSGATLIVIEKDPSLAGALVNKFEGVEVVHGDVLKILAKEINEKGPENYKVVGNIPYYITGKLLRNISELGRKPERAVLMVQKEVAERICEQPPRMNRLAASVQFWAEPKIIMHVPKKDFSPPPKVDSAVIALVRKNDEENILPDLYYKVLRIVFAQPRKTILNNLAAGTTATKHEIASALEEAGIKPTDRPQNLSVKDIITLARALKEGFWG